MRYGIFVDSSCDLKDINSDDIAYARIPLNLDVGEKVFVDNNDLDISVFMKEMESYTGKTGSSAPSPNDWLENYEKCDCIFVITISSALSGSYSSALVAKDMLLEEYPDKKIEIIDSKATGPKMTLVANYIKECIIAGQDFEEIVKNANDYTANKTKLLFILESMENLVKNGRVSKLKGGISKILGIKVLGIASPEGTISLVTTARGKLAIYAKTVEEMIVQAYNGGKVIITNCFNEEKAIHLKNLILEKFPDADISIMPTGGLCSYYAERGGLLIGFEV